MLRLAVSESPFNADFAGFSQDNVDFSQMHMIKCIFARAKSSFRVEDKEFLLTAVGSMGYEYLYHVRCSLQLCEFVPQAQKKEYEVKTSMCFRGFWFVTRRST